jgi:hypothetical protein
MMEGTQDDLLDGISNSILDAFSKDMLSAMQAMIAAAKRSARAKMGKTRRTPPRHRIIRIGYGGREGVTPWPRGPWDYEGDWKEWRSVTGFPCLIIRNFSGSLCGYVGLPWSHRYFRKDEDSFDLSVHGGITYASHGHPRALNSPFYFRPYALSSRRSNERLDIWWLGFDCAHCGDLIPGMEAMRIETSATVVEMGGLPLSWQYELMREDHYWTMEEVRKETEMLAYDLWLMPRRTHVEISLKHKRRPYKL